MKYIHHDKCNYCKSKKIKLIYKLNGQRIVQCRKCLLVYIDKQRADLENLYGKDYYLKNESNMLANYRDYRDQEKIVKRNFRFAYDYIIKNMTQNKNKLLDIGAGFGYFIKYLPSSIKSQAVEVSEEAVDALKTNTKAKVYSGNFLDVDIKNKFDFIVSYDVIEHQNDLIRYLYKIKALLNESGIFIFTTPDFDSPINKIFGKTAPLIQPLYHNYYFTKNWFKSNVPNLSYKIVFLKTSYTANSSIGNIILMSYFACPFLKKIHMLEFAKLMKISNITVPFIRFGGIECILQRI